MSPAECDALNCEHARFGYALTNVGDLDKDGYPGQCITSRSVNQSINQKIFRWPK